MCFKEVYPSINLSVVFLNAKYLALRMPEKIIFIILEWIVHVHDRMSFFLSSSLLSLTMTNEQFNDNWIFFLFEGYLSFQSNSF